MINGEWKSKKLDYTVGYRCIEARTGFTKGKIYFQNIDNRLVDNEGDIRLGAKIYKHGVMFKHYTLTPLFKKMNRIYD